jgi:hypothetical protein
VNSLTFSLILGCKGGWGLPHGSSLDHSIRITDNVQRIDVFVRNRSLQESEHLSEVNQRDGADNAGHGYRKAKEHQKLTV